MNRISLAIIALTACASSAYSQADSTTHFGFYGRLRTDVFYNSRANQESADGFFYMYPKDHSYDADGNDLNSTPEGSMAAFFARVGVDITGYRFGSAVASAKIEADFRGSGTNYSIMRLRHAYVNFAWGRSAMLVGQTWHPMFGDVSPSTLNISTGAPYQPFGRSPMLRYRYTSSPDRGMRLTGAAIWQAQYTSPGPEGKSNRYLKNSLLPELYVGVDYLAGDLTAGVGGEMMTLKPRTESTMDDGSVYKVDERVTSFSGEAHVRYTPGDWRLSAKTVLANNLSHLTTLGGYGVTSTNPVNGERRYTPFGHSATWINAVYGRTWRPGVFVGFLKNLGTGKPVTGPTYGTGLDVDRLMSANAQLTYNTAHWTIGGEICWARAWYGDFDPTNGRIRPTHSVDNLRLLASLMFNF